jgi:hypothetical protein
MKTKQLLIVSGVMFIFSISFTVFNLSCNKPADAQPQSQTFCMGPQPKFQFKANGKLYVCDPVFDKRIGWVMTNGSEFEGYTPGLFIGNDGSELGGGLITTSGEETYINLFLSTTSIPSPGTYNENNIGSDSNFDFDNCSYTGSTHTITFTRVSNGTADGTFSGTVKTGSFSCQTTPKTVTITEGVFSNVPIFQ